MVSFHAFPSAVAAMPDRAVVTVHGLADLHQALVAEFIGQQEHEVTPPGEGMLAATAQHHLGGDVCLSADGYDNGFDRYALGDISEIFVPGYRASTSFFLSL